MSKVIQAILKINPNAEVSVQDKDITLQGKYFEFYQSILKVKTKYPKT